MVPVSDVSTPEREKLSWLTCLIHSYEAEHDWENDEDTDATYMMLQEVRALADELEQKAAPVQEELVTVAQRDPSIPF